MYLRRASWHSSATLTESFLCFSSVLRQMPGQNPQRGVTNRTLPKLILFLYVFFVSFCVFFVCKCVPYYCHRVSTQLQLTNISYHIVSYHIISHHIIIISCQVTSRHVTSYHIIPYISYQITSYHIITYHIIPYHILYHIISYHIISCHIMSCHVMLCVFFRWRGTKSVKLFYKFHENIYSFVSAFQLKDVLRWLRFNSKSVDSSDCLHDPLSQLW